VVSGWLSVATDNGQKTTDKWLADQHEIIFWILGFGLDNSVRIGVIKRLMQTLGKTKEEMKKANILCRFVINFILGFMVLVLLFGVYSTSIGRTGLNMVYDRLVREDFKAAVSKSQRENRPPISDRIRIVAFDRETYAASPSQGFWTPREWLGRSILKSLEMGARVVVVDFAVRRPAPVFCETRETDESKSRETDENQVFLGLMREAAEIAKNNGDSVIVLARDEGRDAEGDEKKSAYEQDFETLLKDYKSVFRWGSAGAYEDPSSYYQLRHFRFYEISEDRKEVFFFGQILAAVYLWHGRDEGDRRLSETKEKILAGQRELTMDMDKPILVYPQEDLTRECLPARYIFRIAPSEVLDKMFRDPAGVNDPLVQYKDRNLILRPHALFAKDPKDGKIYKDKAVLIGSVNPDMGDMYLTPIGKMHGVFLIANGINLFDEGLQLHGNPYINWIPGIITVLVSAFVFLLPYPNLAFFILAVPIFIINFTASLEFLSKHGIFVDFLLPVIGVMIDRILVGVGRFIKKIGKSS